MSKAMKDCTDDDAFKPAEAIIKSSMTKQERRQPDLLNVLRTAPARTDIQQVNALMKKFDDAQNDAHHEQA
jgi:signal recognition particle GTPase